MVKWIRINAFRYLEMFSIVHFIALEFIIPPISKKNKISGWWDVSAGEGAGGQARQPGCHF